MEWHRIFCHLGHTLPCQPPDNPEKQHFKIEKNTWGYYHITHVYHKWKSYDIWFLGYKAWQTGFFATLDHFLPFYPLTIWKITILKKWKKKKTPGDIIILHMCTINNNHMMYGSWDMEQDRQNCLSFWTIFRTFSP